MTHRCALLLVAVVCLAGCNLPAEAKKLRVGITARVFGCSLTLYLPTDPASQEAFLSPAFCIAHDTETLLTTVAPKTDPVSKKTYLDIPVTLTDSRLLAEAQRILKPMLKDQRLTFLHILDMDTRLSNSLQETKSCSSGAHRATYTHVRMVCSAVDCSDQYSLIIRGDWSAIIREELSAVLTDTGVTTGVCAQPKLTVASLAVTLAERRIQLTNLCAPKTEVRISYLSNYHLINGHLSIRSQFVKQFPATSDEVCAILCNTTASCQGFSTEDSTCLLFVFDKCSANVRDCSRSRRGRVYVKKQPGLEPGALCPAGYQDDLCGSKYNVYSGAGNWKSARTKCESDSGLVTMAGLDNVAELRHAESVLKSRKVSSAWLGGRQTPGSAEPAGGWRWIGCNKEVHPSLWHSGEPNNSGNENVIELGRWHANGLNDLAEAATDIAGVMCKCVSPFS